MIKTRFAASPTGFLHIGGLRTALFSYLFAKKNGGKFIMRIEDTDRERLVEGGTENILRSLDWAGIAPDEGVILNKKGEVGEKGRNGPYIQSKRLSIYQKYINELLAGGHAYNCFCSKERLASLRMEQEKNKVATGYDGHCLGLSPEIVGESLRQGKKSVVRMKFPKDRTINFIDLIRGEVRFASKLIDDQVLLKSDGFPTYHFAVVVDDHLMGITHVIRGEEWLPSTPKHIVLYEMFGWRAPAFAHLPLLVNEKKQKLSKRHGDVAVEDFKEKGYLPEALVNFVAFLGWNPGGEQEIFSLKELKRKFDLKKVGKSAAVFNQEKLDWLCGQYIKKMPDKKLAKLVLPFLHKAGLAKDIEENKLVALVTMSRDRMSKLSDIVELSGFIFATHLKYEPSLLVWKKSDSAATRNNLLALANFLEKIEEKYWAEKKLEKKIKGWIEENKYSVGEILWPLRVALSGQKNSPGPFAIAVVLGKEGSLERIGEAGEKLT